METTNRNISMLRQWLNEDRITDPEKMVTNEDIKFWLGNEKCTCKMDEQWNPKIDKSCYWHWK